MFEAVINAVAHRDYFLDGTLDFLPVPEGSAYDEKILSFCYMKARRVSEIAEHLGISDSSYFRKKILDNLTINGYLERSKTGRAVYYKTNSDAVVLK